MSCKCGILLPVNAFKRVQYDLPVRRSYWTAYSTHEMDPAVLVFGTWELVLYYVRKADEAVRDEEQYLFQSALLQTFKHVCVVHADSDSRIA